jgi:hypothetical protein
VDLRKLGVGEARALEVEAVLLRPGLRRVEEGQQRREQVALGADLNVEPLLVTERSLMVEPVLVPVVVTAGGCLSSCGVCVCVCVVRVSGVWYVCRVCVCRVSSYRLVMAMQLSLEESRTR